MAAMVAAHLPHPRLLSCSPPSPTIARLACMQVQDVINNATAKMTAAGAVLVPFDSQVLNDASAMAWGGGLESYDYEDTDTLARCVLQLHCATHQHFGWCELQRQSALPGGALVADRQSPSAPACAAAALQHNNYQPKKLTRLSACRFLYRHNYSISVPEVYYAVNRPDLKALYTSQLLSTDSTRLGSNTNWVHYLQTGQQVPSHCCGCAAACSSPAACYEQLLLSCWQPRLPRHCLPT